MRASVQGGGGHSGSRSRFLVWTFGLIPWGWGGWVSCSDGEGVATVSCDVRDSQVGQAPMKEMDTRKCHWSVRHSRCPINR